MAATTTPIALRPGDIAPLVALPDQTGALLEVASLWQKKPLVLVFVRHAGCPLCRAHVAELRDEQQQFAAAGAEIAVIAMGTPAQVAEFRQFNRLPFVCLADEKQVAYRAFGIPRGNVLQVAGPGVWASGFHSIWKHGAGQIIGDKYQLPGTVIVDTTGHVQFVYYGRDSSDWPPNATLLAALAGSKTT